MTSPHSSSPRPDETLLLGKFSTATRKRLTECLIPRRFKRGTALFHESAPPTSAHLLIRGLVKSVKSAPKGQAAAMEVLPPGRWCGVIALMDQRPYPVSVFALQDAETWELPAESFRDLMARHPDFSRAMFAEVGEHLRRAQTMRALATAPVERRIAYWLTLLLPHRGAEIRLRREDIAEMAGCIPETAIRVLSDFRKRGVLKTGWKRFVLENPAALARLAEEKT